MNDKNHQIGDVIRVKDKRYTINASGESIYLVDYIEKPTDYNPYYYWRVIPVYYEPPNAEYTGLIFMVDTAKKPFQIVAVYSEKKLPEFLQFYPSFINETKARKSFAIHHTLAKYASESYQRQASGILAQAGMEHGQWVKGQAITANDLEKYLMPHPEETPDVYPFKHRRFGLVKFPGPDVHEVMMSWDFKEEKPVTGVVHVLGSPNTEIEAIQSAYTDFERYTFRLYADEPENKRFFQKLLVQWSTANPHIDMVSAQGKEYVLSQPFGIEDFFDNDRLFSFIVCTHNDNVYKVSIRTENEYMQIEKIKTKDLIIAINNNKLEHTGIKSILNSMTGTPYQPSPVLAYVDFDQFMSSFMPKFLNNYAKNNKNAHLINGYNELYAHVIAINADS